MLAASGQLNLKRGGPGVRPPLPPEVVVTLLKNQWPVTKDAAEHNRRSIYLFVRRNLRFPFLEVFDKPDTNLSCSVRSETTIAPQALHLLNSEFSLECARQLAARLESIGGSEQERIEQCWQLVLGRAARCRRARRRRRFPGCRGGWRRLDGSVPGDVQSQRVCVSGLRLPVATSIDRRTKKPRSSDRGDTDVRGWRIRKSCCQTVAATAETGQRRIAAAQRSGMASSSTTTTSPPPSRVSRAATLSSSAPLSSLCRSVRSSTS